jgi:hypothetical protein
VENCENYRTFMPGNAGKCKNNLLSEHFSNQGRSTRVVKKV